MRNILLVITGLCVFTVGLALGDYTARQELAPKKQCAKCYDLLDKQYVALTTCLLARSSTLDGGVPAE